MQNFMQIPPMGASRQMGEIYAKIFIYVCLFYAWKQLLLSVRLSHRNSVRLSIRPSHAWISQKRCNLVSPKLHSQLPGRL